MGTQKSQPVNITVNIVFPESWTEEARSTFLEHYLADLEQMNVEFSGWLGHVPTVKKSSEAEELAESITASPTMNMGCSFCNYKGEDVDPVSGDAWLCATCMDGYF